MSTLVQAAALNQGFLEPRDLSTDLRDPEAPEISYKITYIFQTRRFHQVFKGLSLPKAPGVIEVWLASLFVFTFLIPV